MTSTLHYEDLLQMAAGNARKGEKKIKTESSQFPLKPKKVDPKAKKLSEGVQKFLQQRAEEERRQAEERQKQKEKLMALRSQDRKAHKRVNSMLRMTKSANKACIADAKNSFSDALAEQGDEQQPDEDDYGYETQSSQEWRKKLLDRYKQIPSSKPARRGNPVNVPVPQSLINSKSKSHQSEDECSDEKAQSNVNVSTNNKSNNANSKVKKRPPPDALNFQALLELANQKSREPIEFCKPLKPNAKVEKESFEYGRPMTAKEKAAYLQEKAFKDKIQSGNITLPPPPDAKSLSVAGKQSSQSQGVSSKGDFKIPSMKKKEVSIKSEPPFVEDKPVVKKPLKPPPSPPRQQRPPSKQPPPSSKPTSAPERRRRSPSPSNSKVVSASNSNSRLPPSNNSKFQSSSSSRSPLSNNSKVPPNNNSRLPPPTPNSKSSPNNNARIPPPYHNSSRDPPSSKSRMPPSNNSRMPPSNASRMPPSNPSRMPPSNASRMPPSNPSRMQPSNASRMPPPRPRPKQPPPQKRRMVIDSDEEYDSEMDDFIADDEEEGGINYSDMIRALTGYDRNKFKDVDDDDIQESSVFEQWMEEKRSARIGKLEDDEEERKEAEERKRKMLMKKKKMRR